MFRRSLFLLPAVLAAVALPAVPAFAGGDDDDASSATLRAPQSCVSGHRATLAVTGDDIDTVRFYLDGERIKTVTQPGAGGRYRLSMRCARLTVGAHTGRAVVAFEEGASRTLRFQLTRARQGSPRFTG